jgi:hypothetical protein
VRAFFSPDANAVAWLTGPAKFTCDDCHEPSCAEPEAIVLRGD